LAASGIANENASREPSGGNQRDEFGKMADAFLDRELRKLGFVPFEEHKGREQSRPLRAVPDRKRVRAVLKALQDTPTKSRIECDPDKLWDLAESVRKNGRCYSLQSVSYDDDGLDQTYTERDEPIPLELGMPLFRQLLKPNKYDRLRDIWLTQFENGITVQVDQMTGIRHVSDQTTCYALQGETAEAVVGSIFKSSGPSAS
jgi:hypothetical protein